MKRLFICPLLLLLSTHTCAVENTAIPAAAPVATAEDSFIHKLFRRTIIGVGATVRTDELKITDNKLGGQGTLVRERGLEPLLTIGFENAYFGDSRWGYSAVFGYTQFDMEKQKIGDSNSDVGTSADGSLLFIAPSIYYMFGAKHYEGWYLKPGLALGIGYLQTKGDVLLTSLAGNPRHDFDIKSDPLSLSVGAFLETGYKDWFFRFQVAGPIVEEDDRNFQGTTVGISLGYTFHPFRNF